MKECFTQIQSKEGYNSNVQNQKDKITTQTQSREVYNSDTETQMKGWVITQILIKKLKQKIIFRFKKGYNSDTRSKEGLNSDRHKPKQNAIIL